MLNSTVRVDCPTAENDDIGRESANIMHLPELRLPANQLRVVLDE